MTTAEILYHLPDHPRLLQSYTWQDLDLAPNYPILNGFVRFWMRELDGAIHSVRLATTDLITPEDLAYVNISMSLH